MKDKLSDINRLYHVRDCIHDLKAIMDQVSEDDFYRNTEKKYATERILEIIAEAVGHISKETLEKTTVTIDWAKIKGFRTIVVHEYFRVDYTIVFKIATKNILILEEAINDLIRN